MEVRPLIGALGAEVLNVDTAEASAELVQHLRALLWEHQVLVIRDQKLTCEQHIALARKFGPIHAQPFNYAKVLPGHPEILPVIKEKTDTKVFGEKWHADVTYLERPLLGALLYALETPPRGGDTLFSNMYRAYDALSDGMKKMLENLVAEHEGSVPDGDPVTGERYEPVRLVHHHGEHPVVMTHPETGKKLLYVNTTYTMRFKGMTDAESAPLLQYLCAHATEAEFTARVHWKPGTLVIWDNRSVQHLPINDYYGYRREMHRITVST
jgi:taurine dioxygenase